MADKKKPDLVSIDEINERERKSGVMYGQAINAARKVMKEQGIEGISESRRRRNRNTTGRETED